MRHQATLVIPIDVRRRNRQPLHDQIAAQIAAAVEQGRLTHRCRLPSTRNLAGELGVSRGVVSAAYDLLFTRGYLDSRARSGTYVTAPAGPGTSLIPDIPRADPPVIDLRPGQPSTEAFPLPAWRAAWRHAGHRQPPLHDLPALGLPALRRAVAEYLRTTRGLSLNGRAVVITGGVVHGLRSVIDALGLCGAEVAVEEPMPPAVHRAVGVGPDRPTALPVDADGAGIDAMPAACRAMLLSPFAQLAAGHPRSDGSRSRAGAWAARTGGHVIEVARDTMLGSAPETPADLTDDTRILLGGFCELLTPTLKLGYAVVPLSLAETIQRRLGGRAEQPPHVTQVAVAGMLTDGTVLRLLRRLAALRAGKRQVLDAALAGIGIDIEPVPATDAADARVCHLPDGVDAEHAAAQLLRRGVRVQTLAPYYFSGQVVPPALVVAFGHLPDPALRRALAVLRDVLTDVVSPAVRCCPVLPDHGRDGRRPQAPRGTIDDDH